MGIFYILVASLSNYSIHFLRWNVKFKISPHCFPFLLSVWEIWLRKAAAADSFSWRWSAKNLQSLRLAWPSAHRVQSWAGPLFSTLDFEGALDWTGNLQIWFCVLLLTCIHVSKPVVNMGLTGSSYQRAKNLSLVSPPTKLHLQRHPYSILCCFHMKETKPLIKLSFKKCFPCANWGYKETSI